MRTKFGPAYILRLPTPDKLTDYMDPQYPNLVLRILPKTGTKTFYYRYNTPRGRQNYRLTTFEAINVTASWKSVLELYADARIAHKRGDDLQATRQAIREELKAMPTVADALELYYESMKRRKLKSAYSFYRQLINHMVPAIGKKPLDTVAKKDITLMINGMLDKGYSGAITSIIKLSKAFFNWAIETDYITKNPVHKIKNPAVNGTRFALSEPAIRLMFKHAPDKLYKHILLYMFTGARLNEVLEAKKTEFDFANNVWHLPPGRDKTGAGRTIPINDSACLIIQNLFYGKEPDANLSDYSTTAFYKDFNKFKKEYMQDHPDFSTHHLRHTTTTLLAQLGTPEEVISAYVGHKHRSMTSTYLHHAYADEVKEASKKLEDHIMDLIRDRRALASKEG